METRDYQPVIYMYETPETGLFESRVIIEGLEFASVHENAVDIYTILQAANDAILWPCNCCRNPQDM